MNAENRKHLGNKKKNYNFIPKMVLFPCFTDYFFFRKKNDVQKIIKFVYCKIGTTVAPT